MNRIELSAIIVEAKPIRVTPAGIPILELRLEHESQTIEAKTPRQIKLKIRAVALAETAQYLVSQAVGTQWIFQGFLTTPKNGQTVIFHIQEYQEVKSNSDDVIAE